MSAKTKLLIAFLLFACLNRVMADDISGGTIKGAIITFDGKPVEDITVSIKENKRGTLTNEKGEYLLKNIKPGTYTLEISAVGIVPQEKYITLAEGQTLIEDFTINLTAQQLQDVMVSTQQNKFNKSSSADVAKMPLKNLENPQVYSIVTNALLQEQLNTNMTQALNNIPGAVATTDAAGGTSITMRGFTAEPAARNGVPVVYGRASIDPVNIESIEALKGPSATLFGNFIASYGGAVNIVTKKPFDVFRGEIGYSFGSWGLNRVTADINTPLNEDKTALLRVNAAVARQQSFQQSGHNNVYAFDPSFMYKASDKLTLSVDMEIYGENLMRVPFLNFSRLSVTNLNQVPVGYKQTFYDDSYNAVTNTLNTYLRARYQVSKNWVSQTDISISNENVNHSYQAYPTFLDATHIQRGITLFGPITETGTDIQHNLQGDFKIGSVRNRLVWGVDYFNSTNKFDYASATLDTLDITKSYTPVTNKQADYALETRGSASQYPSAFQQYATYASDLVNITDNLLALAGARIDRYELKGNSGYNQTSVSPKFGLIYQPVKDKISIFGNYMSGFTNNAPAVQPDGTQVVFKPSYAKQWEAGVKLNMVKNRLTGTVSYYNIDISDAIRYDADNFAYQDGSERSKGIDASLSGSPVAGLDINAGYVYNNHKYVKASSGEGKQAQFNPQDIANFWIGYTFQQASVLRNWGVGFGGNYSDKSYYDADNTIIIPSYTILNATVFYNRPKWRAGIALNNLTNKEYWAHSNFANPQPLRNVTANLTIRF